MRVGLRVLEDIYIRIIKLSNPTTHGGSHQFYFGCTDMLGEDQEWSVMENAVSSSCWACSRCRDLRPGAVVALVDLPAYSKRRFRWASVCFITAPIRSRTKCQAPPLYGSSCAHTVSCTLGYISMTCRTSRHGKGCSSSIRVMAALVIFADSRCLCKAA